ncbi:hypothetical protein EDD18DRAFT_1363705 [Armillaria luteobubalina]|uniref:Uncharacterized protein n=1 Tax=Armillaria luteobubalina TaxID=153913 RepID=A0AA39UFL4_9AGAR|nr:hypothetical protein EDD18DRAFT_1363705 [Armillaria luteobubalina]
MRPREDGLEGLGPNFHEYWEKNFADKPDKPLFGLSVLGGFPGAHSGLPPLKFTAMGCFLVGAPFYMPIISPNLLRRDIQLLVDIFTSLLRILTPILKAGNKSPSWETSCIDNSNAASCG